MLPLKEIWVLKGKFHFLAQKIPSVYQILLFLWIECFNLHFPKVRTIRKSLTVKQNFKIQHTHFCFCPRWRRGAWIYFLSEITTKTYKIYETMIFKTAHMATQERQGTKGCPISALAYCLKRTSRLQCRTGNPSRIEDMELRLGRLWWPELTGHYARKERAAQGEDLGICKSRPWVYSRVYIHQCLQNYLKMGEKKKNKRIAPGTCKSWE